MGGNKPMPGSASGAGSIFTLNGRGYNWPPSNKCQSYNYNHDTLEAIQTWALWKWSDIVPSLGHGLEEHFFTACHSPSNLQIFADPPVNAANLILVLAELGEGSSDRHCDKELLNPRKSLTQDTADSNEHMTFRQKVADLKASLRPSNPT
jgi:hypothetical protein